MGIGFWGFKIGCCVYFILFFIYWLVMFSGGGDGKGSLVF